MNLIEVAQAAIGVADVADNVVHLIIQTFINIILILMIFPRRAEFHELVNRVTRLVLDNDSGATAQVRTEDLKRLSEVLERADASPLDVVHAAEALVWKRPR